MNNQITGFTDNPQLRNEEEVTTYVFSSNLLKSYHTRSFKSPVLTPILWIQKDSNVIKSLIFHSMII